MTNREKLSALILTDDRIWEFLKTLDKCLNDAATNDLRTSMMVSTNVDSALIIATSNPKLKALVKKFGMEANGSRS